MRLALPVLLLASTAWAAASAAPPAPITSCEPVGASRPLCGYQNPEDLAALPGERALLVSEFGGMSGGHGGSLALLVLDSEERRVIYRGSAESSADEPTAGWGDPACPSGPSSNFSPHGIDLARRPDGSLALAVVQHGDRESIELFEVSGSGEDWRVAWRGCLLAPEDSWLNEVVLLSDGSLLTSHMMLRSEGMLGYGMGKPGWVWRWTPGGGFTKVAGSTVRVANGFEVSADEKTLYLNSSVGDGLRRIDLASGKVTATASLMGLDNTTWAPDGKLLVASVNAASAEDFAVCTSLESGACPMPFQIIAVDPQTFETSVRFDSAGSPMGAGTVGLQVGTELFIGSFAGDRILRVQLTQDATP